MQLTNQPRSTDHKYLNIYFYLFIGIYLFFLLFAFIYPPFNSDSVRYSLTGNPFLLQYLDYIGFENIGAFIHGRYITHTLLRTLLQMPEPLLTIFFSSLLTFIVFIYCCAIKPTFYKKIR